MLEQYGLEPTRAKAVQIGDVFGRLVVVFVGQRPNSYKYYALCWCMCGSKGLHKIRFDHLISDITKGCGCVHKEAVTTHGLTKSPHYDRWWNMMDRCYNPECAAYDNYGGRGISVCVEWHDVATYISQLPLGYEPGMDLDRRENDGNYELPNVRWVTRKVNSNNTRTALDLTINGRTQSLNDWAEEVGISPTLIHSRLQHGFTPERAVMFPQRGTPERKAIEDKLAAEALARLPPKKELKRYEFQGESFTLYELSEKYGVTVKLLRKRIDERGWTVERAVTT